MGLHLYVGRWLVGAAEALHSSQVDYVPALRSHEWQPDLGSDAWPAGLSVDTDALALAQSLGAAGKG